MKGFDFPVINTKTKNAAGQEFMLEDPAERRKYFKLKVGPEIEKIKKYLRRDTFVGFLLGPKNSGKGTYTKLFMEAVGSDKVVHVSVGDLVRSVHKELSDKKKKKELVEFLKKNYRGAITVESALDVILGRDTKTLLPTEIILALAEREIGRHAGKAVFIDGFPRNLDQISYSLYFRALMGYRDDPDFFIFIDVPEAVIDERMKFRVICPECHTPRNLKLLCTKEVEYDAKKKVFHLLCDNQTCSGYGKTRLVAKEGDELGIEVIRDRIEADSQVTRKLMSLEGISKIYLRNSVPVDVAKKMVDDYEITPSYRYELDENGKIKVVEEPYTVEDDDGKEVYSLLPAPIAVHMIRQIAKTLGL